MSRRKLGLVVVVTLVVAAGLLASVDDASAQCAMCVSALQQNGGKLVGGFNRAILFLLVMPYLVFGSVAATWYWKQYRAKVAARTPAPGAVPVRGTAADVPVLIEDTGV